MIFDATALGTAVRTVLPATKTTHLPILRGVLLEPIGGRLSLTATDLDLTITTTLKDPLPGALECVVPGSVLAAWLDGRSGEVSLEVDGNDLLLTSDTGGLRLRTMPVDDWPKTEQALGEAHRLSSEERARLLGILHAASRDTARPILNGVGIADGWACCTDSYRLAAVRLEGLPEAILPVRFCEQALKGDGEATLTVDDRRATVVNGATTFTGRLIEGRFPTWQPLAAAPKTTVTVDRDAVLEALGRVLVLADNVETPVRVAPDGDGLTFRVVALDVGEVVERVAGGAELSDTFGFRPRLLIDLLRWREEAKVEVGITDSLHPVSVRDDTTVGLVMPVRL